MEDVSNVVARIVDRANLEAVQVSPTLAAFVARTVILENPVDFQLDTKLSDKDVDALVSRAVSKLALKDSPQMETLRMQVDFDSLFMETEDALRRAETDKKSRRSALKANIVNMDHSAGSEYEMINAMYRQVFNFLIACAGADVAKNTAVEREIAAALESVFPKIGLKAFMLMEVEDQKLQLGELASIVMGIRLFNRRIGKGGAGIKDIPDMARASAQKLLQVLREEKEVAQATCQEYSSTLVFAHRCKPGQGPEEAKVERWQDELNNRRQYLSFVSSLEDDAIHALQTLQKLSDQLEDVLMRLQELVGQNSSVSKDQVYPKFDLAAEIWSNLRQEHELIQSRHVVWNSLENFRESFTFTLDAHWLESALQDERINSRDVQYGSSKRSILETAPSLESIKASAPPTPATAQDSASTEGKSAAEDERATAESKTSQVAELLTPESTPEFMNLPLDFQGYCPVTAARRGGLLLPGDPSFGVVRHGETHAVFFSDECAKEFMRDPEGVLQALIAVARRYPELISLLELQRHFPDTFLLSYSRAARNVGSKLSGQSANQKPLMLDAGTETPTHFVERHIDPNYEWNEWALRRKALQLVNLRNARTSSSQTVKSHFRRESETQVYLPKETGTQTGISKATNPPKKLQYVAGLRGLSSTRFTKFASDSSESKSSDEQKEATRCNVVRMTLEY